MIRILDAAVLPAFLALAWVIEGLGYIDQAQDLRAVVKARREDIAEEMKFNHGTWR